MASPLWLRDTAATNTTEALVICTSAVPGKHGNVPIDACNSYYMYEPTFGSAVAFTVLFSIVTLVQIGEAIAFRKGFCWTIIMGAFWEALAMAFHALGARDQQNQAYAVAHTLVFLLAPMWINAAVYMTAGRLVHFFLPEKQIFKIKAPLLARYFVLADILGFILQGIGGVMLSPGASKKSVDQGLNWYMAGIATQEFFICIFAVIVLAFHLKMWRLERHGAMLEGRDGTWRWMVWTIYGVLALITVRIAYRLAEFAGGFQPSNPLPYDEVYMLNLDALPMLLALTLLCVVHPGMVLVGPESEFPTLSRKEKKALKKEKKAAKKAAREQELENWRTVEAGAAQPSGNFDFDFHRPRVPAKTDQRYAGSQWI